MMKTIRVANPDETDTEAAIGKVVDGYRIKRKVASGGMGTVYEATHEHLGRRYAVKILHSHLIGNTQIVSRFIAEGQRTNCVDIDGVVAIHHVGRTTTGLPFLVMDFIDGETLASHRLRLFGRRDERTRRRGRTLRPTPSTNVVLNALRLARQLAQTMALIHQQGVVHRDLKPDNIFVVRDACVSGGNRIKILDFGIAKVVDRNQPPPSQSYPWAPTFEPTIRGTILGTPAYMSPEQWHANGIVHPRTDVYACGVIFYELMSGQTPFFSEFIGQLMEQHLTQQPTPLVQIEPWVPLEFSSLIDSMLRKNPSERPDMASVLDAIDQILRTYIAIITSAQASMQPVGGFQTMFDGLLVRQGRGLLDTDSIVDEQLKQETDLLFWRKQKARFIALFSIMIVFGGLYCLAKATGDKPEGDLRADRSLGAGSAVFGDPDADISGLGSDFVVNTEPQGSHVYLTYESDESLNGVLSPRCHSTPCKISKDELKRADAVLLITQERYRGRRLSAYKIKSENYQHLLRMQPMFPERAKAPGRDRK